MRNRRDDESLFQDFENLLANTGGNSSEKEICSDTAYRRTAGFDFQAACKTEKMLKGKIIELHAAQLSDRKDVYNWLAYSDLTSSMMGPPDFPDHPIPSYDEFLNDYTPHFFDGSKPGIGQSFIIYFDGSRCGQINFDTDSQLNNMAELDIWLSAEKFTGKGIGSDAIETLSDYLLSELKFEALIIAPSKRNIRAIRAYQKAGFVFTDEVATPAPGYADAGTLIKRKAADKD